MRMHAHDALLYTAGTHSYLRQPTYGRVVGYPLGLVIPLSSHRLTTLILHEMLQRLSWMGACNSTKSATFSQTSSAKRAAFELGTIPLQGGSVLGQYQLSRLLLSESHLVCVGRAWRISVYRPYLSNRNEINQVKMEPRKRTIRDVSSSWLRWLGSLARTRFSNISWQRPLF